MSFLRPTLKALLADERGATAIEYGLIAALIVVGILGAMDNFAAANDANYQKLEDEIAS
jgi:pilus assembly protein Flp/PilA